VQQGVFFNPHIVKHSSRKVLDWEGCLSIPNFRGLTPRSASVVLETVLPNGQKVRLPFKGFAARIVQHETDHVNGLFYVDRMKDLGMWMHNDEFESVSKPIRKTKRQFLKTNRHPLVFDQGRKRDAKFAKKK
jgi:peptide deformylase